MNSKNLIKYAGVMPVVESFNWNDAMTFTLWFILPCAHKTTVEGHAVLI